MGLMVNFNEDPLLGLAPLEKKEKGGDGEKTKEKEGKETHLLSQANLQKGS